MLGGRKPEKREANAESDRREAAGNGGPLPRYHRVNLAVRRNGIATLFSLQLRKYGPGSMRGHWTYDFDFNRDNEIQVGAQSASERARSPEVLLQ